MTVWLTTIAVVLAAMVVVTIIGRLQPPHQDDGVRPVWIGHCGGVDYRWHYDPRTVPSGQYCVVERVEQ